MPSILLREPPVQWGRVAVAVAAADRRGGVQSGGCRVCATCETRLLWSDAPLAAGGKARVACPVAVFCRARGSSFCRSPTAHRAASWPAGRVGVPSPSWSGKRCAISSEGPPSWCTAASGLVPPPARCTGDTRVRQGEAAVASRTPYFTRCVSPLSLKRPRSPVRPQPVPTYNHRRLGECLAPTGRGRPQLIGAFPRPT